jgi:hypothetical protein
VTSTLQQWLSDQSTTTLTGIIARRPDVLSPHPPATLAELADRLHRQHSLRGVLWEMPRPCLDVLETLLIFGSGGMTRAHLAATLDLLEDDAALAATLATCEMWAIAWEVGDRIWIPGALRTICATPLRLGPPVTDFLNTRSVDDLRVRAQVLGLVTNAKVPRKTDLLAALSSFYADGDAIRAVAARAPQAQRELLALGAIHEPILAIQTAHYYAGRADPAIAWLLQHGLIINDWQHTAIPREVGIALRGPGWHPTLTRYPDPMPTTPIAAADPVAAVAHDAASAAGIAIEQFSAVVEASGRTPLAILKTGGIGVREIRRLAKTTGVGEALVRLWLEIAFSADMVDVDADELVPTPTFDDWLALSPARRAAALIDAWVDLTSMPLLEFRPDGVPARPALTPDEYASVASHLRLDVLRAVAGLPDGVSVADGSDALAAMVAWARPIASGSLDDPSYAVDAIWAESVALGLIGRGALSPLGRVLTDDPDGDPASDRLARLESAAAACLQDATAEAIFQADLTVVVPGAPDASVAALLDGVADRESRGAAATWRCSASSVRRAFDSGQTADGIVEALRSIAIGGTLPQPLEYLIADVARRHGTLRARTVGSILRADDPALLAEIVATKSLASLRLTALAPTVLASALPLDRTLAALRTAGFAPIGEADDGAPLVERPQSRRAPGRAHILPFRGRDADDPGPYAIVRQRSPMTPAQVAATLAGTGGTERGGGEPMLRLVPEARLERLPNAPVRIPTLRVVQRSARQLGADEQHILAQAIDNERPIEITYTDGSDETTTRVIEPRELDGSMLTAWCRLRHDERGFILGRIESVRPLTPR